MMRGCLRCQGSMGWRACLGAGAPRRAAQPASVRPPGIRGRAPAGVRVVGRAWPGAGLSSPACHSARTTWPSKGQAGMLRAPSAAVRVLSQRRLRQVAPRVSSIRRRRRRRPASRRRAAARGSCGCSRCGGAPGRVGQVAASPGEAGTQGRRTGWTRACACNRICLFSCCLRPRAFLHPGLAPSQWRRSYDQAVRGRRWKRAKARQYGY